MKYFIQIGEERTGICEVLPGVDFHDEEFFQHLHLWDHSDLPPAERFALCVIEQLPVYLSRIGEVWVSYSLLDRFSIFWWRIQKPQLRWWQRLLFDPRSLVRKGVARLIEDRLITHRQVTINGHQIGMYRSNYCEGRRER